MYSTNHSQPKWHTFVTRMPHVCAACAKAKTCMASNHACKVNIPHTCIYPYKVFATKQSSLQPVASTLSFTIYAYRTIFGRMVTNILGQPRRTGFVATCS